MASLVGLIHRNWLAAFPPEVPKTENALRFGILGAAKIAPSALIAPAKSHPDVIVLAVAARDKKKAMAYAKKHGIPQVLNSYQDLLDDPSIDAVYIPLPNGLHLEWALRALARGKHVLLEKPSVSNFGEAEVLFRSPLLKPMGAAGNDAGGTGDAGRRRPPVLLEAFHYRFQPGWQYFLGLIDRPNLDTALSVLKLPSYFFPKDDIRFQYALSGGTMMDLGTYPFSTLRDIFGSEPDVCLECTARRCDPPFELCDAASVARFQFPGGCVGEAQCDLQASVATVPLPLVTVSHKPVAVSPEEAAAAAAGGKLAVPEHHECVRIRRLSFANYIQCAYWHRITIEDEFVVRRIDSPDAVARRWTKKQTKKIYTFRDAGVDQQSEPWWTSYRYQLDAFVKRAQQQTRSGVWISEADSLAQARMIDMAYAKAGLPLRPTSSFQQPTLGQANAPTTTSTD